MPVICGMAGSLLQAAPFSLHPSAWGEREEEGLTLAWIFCRRGERPRKRFFRFKFSDTARRAFSVQDMDTTRKIHLSHLSRLFRGELRCAPGN